MLTEEQVAFFHANGYVTTGEPLLSSAEVQTLRDALDQVIAGTSPDRPHLLRNMAGGGLDSDKVVVQIVNIWQAHPAYREHIARTDIVEMALQLAPTDTLRVWHDQIQYKPPNVGTSTRWHQDFPRGRCSRPPISSPPGWRSTTRPWSTAVCASSPARTVGPTSIPA